MRLKEVENKNKKKIKKGTQSSIKLSETLSLSNRLDQRAVGAEDRTCGNIQVKRYYRKRFKRIPTSTGSVVQEVVAQPSSWYHSSPARRIAAAQARKKTLNDQSSSFDGCLCGKLHARQSPIPYIYSVSSDPNREKRLDTPRLNTDIITAFLR